jgi:hypothetical protein
LNRHAILKPAKPRPSPEANRETGHPLLGVNKNSRAKPIHQANRTNPIQSLDACGRPPLIFALASAPTPISTKRSQFALCFQHFDFDGFALPLDISPASNGGATASEAETVESNPELTAAQSREGIENAIRKRYYRSHSLIGTRS